MSDHKLSTCETRKILALVRKQWNASSEMNPFYLTDIIPVTCSNGATFTFERFATQYTVDSINKRQLKLGPSPELITIEP